MAAATNGSVLPGATSKLGATDGSVSPLANASARRSHQNDSFVVAAAADGRVRPRAASAISVGRRTHQSRLREILSGEKRRVWFQTSATSIPTGVMVRTGSITLARRAACRCTSALWRAIWALCRNFGAVHILHAVARKLKL